MFGKPSLLTKLISAQCKFAYQKTFVCIVNYIVRHSLHSTEDADDEAGGSGATSVDEMLDEAGAELTLEATDATLDAWLLDETTMLETLEACEDWLEEDVTRLLAAEDGTDASEDVGLSGSLDAAEVSEEAEELTTSCDVTLEEVLDEDSLLTLDTFADCCTSASPVTST